MGSTAIIAAIDKELARLHGVRSKLLKQAKKSASENKKGKRRLSPAGRARIAAAQRKRWAAIRKNRDA